MMQIRVSQQKSMSKEAGRLLSGRPKLPLIYLGMKRSDLKERLVVRIMMVHPKPKIAGMLTG